MKKFFRTAAAVIGAAAYMLLGTCVLMSREIPDGYSVNTGEKLSFSGGIPVTGHRASGAMPAVKKKGGHYEVCLKLFGVVPIKKAAVHIVPKTMVIPSGDAFGLKMYMDGVMVVGMSDVDTKSGKRINPAYKAGIRVGDMLIAVNGRTVSGNEDIQGDFEKSGGHTVAVNYKRGGLAMCAKVTPVRSKSSGRFRAGIWVRDSTAGIGTVTFYDPAGKFYAGLGHGICDVDTGELMPLMTGEIVKAEITGVKRGENGDPGQLNGYLSEAVIGTLGRNTESGVFGRLTSAIVKGKPLPVAMCQQVHTGKAQIIATLDKKGPQRYQIEIVSVDYGKDIKSKNMVIKITDKRLIEKTGGIVQGMSGCPIIQDGRLAGAVTHVFVTNSTKGYGIFAENMINTAKGLEKSE